MKEKRKLREDLRKHCFDKSPGSINRKGKPKGSRNRSTIARELLELKSTEGLRYEEAITIKMLKKAHEDGDVSAYKAIMDSAYGPAQTNQTVEGDEHKGLRPLFGDSMDDYETNTDNSVKEDTEDKD